MTTERQTVTHITENGRYRIMIERAASTKGIDGFKVEANGDSMEDVAADANALYETAKRLTHVQIPAPEAKPTFQEREACKIQNVLK